jgi:hypothetical protein
MVNTLSWGDSAEKFVGSSPTESILNSQNHKEYGAQNSTKHIIKMHSSMHIPKRIQRSVADGLSLRGVGQGKVQSFISTKNRKKTISLTLISGPHVHKKSRDQYKIQKYTAWFSVILPWKKSRKVLFEFLSEKQKRHPEIEFAITHFEKEQVAVR